MGFKSLHLNHTMNILFETHVRHESCLFLPREVFTSLSISPYPSPFPPQTPKPFLARALKAANQINKRRIKMLNSAARETF